MKRILASVMAIVMAMSVFAGCSGKKTLKEGTTLQQISETIDKEFGEYGAVTGMPAEIDDQILTEAFHVNKDDVEEYYGRMAMSMTNSDALVLVKAKADKVESVKASLEQKKKDLEAQFEMYNVNGSYQRAKDSEVYVVGDYVFFLCVGIMPDEIGETEPTFEGDVAKAKEIIDGFFK